MIQHDEIDRLIDWAEASQIRGDGEWDQATYTNWCGTSFCIAGKHMMSKQDWTWNGSSWVLGGRCYPSWFASSVARRDLGLNGDQADLLFAGNNTIEDLRRIAKGFREETP